MKKYLSINNYYNNFTISKKQERYQDKVKFCSEQCKQLWKKK
jgi:hypothetical protein